MVEVLSYIMAILVVMSLAVLVVYLVVFTTVIIWGWLDRSRKTPLRPKGRFVPGLEELVESFRKELDLLKTKKM